MGTEVAISFSSLRAELENERSSLFKIDENIKKIVQTSGRFQNDRFNFSSDYTRGGGRQGGRNSFPDTGKSDDPFGKRKHETKTVFSRLSARVQDSDGEGEGEEEGPAAGGKRLRVPSAVCRELPTRAAVVRAQGQGDDEQARTRNRRMFGSLLGTLHKFKQEEIGLQTKEEKKAQVERKIEEQARLQKEKELKERKSLFADREQKKATIKALEAKMGRVQEFEKWEESQKNLGNFILTKVKPHVYWLPKKMTDKATEKLNSSRKFHEKCMIKKRQELQEELHRIEQRCLRIRGPGAKENDPETHADRRKNSVSSEHDKDAKNDDKGKKRDKFAMDEDDKEKEDSDGEERQEVNKEDEEMEPKVDKDVKDSKMDTSAEQNTTMESEATNGVTVTEEPPQPETDKPTESHKETTDYPQHS